MVSLFFQWNNWVQLILFILCFTACVGSLALSMCYLFVPTARTLCREFGFRVVTVIGGALMAFGLFLTASVPSIDKMYLTYGVIFGFGSSLVFYASSEVVCKCFAQCRYLAAMVMSLSTGSALASMAPFLQFSLADYGFMSTFYILSEVSL